MFHSILDKQSLQSKNVLQEQITFVESFGMIYNMIGFEEFGFSIWLGIKN